MSHSFRRKLTFATALVMFAGMVGTASAETTWQKNHPRRTQVNHRLANQNRRIHNDVKKGTLTRGQAAALHKDDHLVRHEERDMARQNGSGPSEIQIPLAAQDGRLFVAGFPLMALPPLKFE